MVFMRYVCVCVCVSVCVCVCVCVLGVDQFILTHSEGQAGLSVSSDDEWVLVLPTSLLALVQEGHNPE